MSGGPAGDAGAPGSQDRALGPVGSAPSSHLLPRGKEAQRGWDPYPEPHSPPEGRAGEQPHLLLPTVPRSPQRHAPWQQPPNPVPNYHRAPGKYQQHLLKALNTQHQLRPCQPGPEGAAEAPGEKGQKQTPWLSGTALEAWAPLSLPPTRLGGTTALEPLNPEEYGEPSTRRPLSPPSTSVLCPSVFFRPHPCRQSWPGPGSEEPCPSSNVEGLKVPGDVGTGEGQPPWGTA